MAVGFVLEFPNGTRADYDTVMQELGLSGPDPQWPIGSISHAAGPLEGGGWVVVDEWESKEDFERFFNERLHRALTRAGLEAPQPRWFQLYNYRKADAGQTIHRRAA